MRSLVPLILLSAPVAGFAAGRTPAPAAQAPGSSQASPPTPLWLATDLDQLLNAKPPANKSIIHHGLFQ